AARRGPAQAARPAVPGRRGEPVRHPGGRARGMPDRLRRLDDRAAARVLRQKCDLGLLDPGWPGARDTAGGSVAESNGEVLDLDPPGHRALARRLAEESVVLLANRDAALPLRPRARIAVTGPLADDPLAFYGCYSMPRHLGGRYPEAAEGPPSATVLAALRAELPGAEIDYAPSCTVRDQD